MIEQLKTIRAGLETATCYSMLGVDAHSVQIALTALTQLEAMVGEPWLDERGYTLTPLHTAAPVAQQYEAGDVASAAAQGFRDGVASVTQQPPKLEDIEQYRLQMAGISTAAIGYWKEGDSIHPDYDTLALHDVAKLYAKYDALYKAQQPQARPDFTDEWTGYLKDGETPFERFLRERKDLQSILKLYQRALEENERLKAQQPQAELLKSLEGLLEAAEWLTSGFDEESLSDDVCRAMQCARATIAKVTVSAAPQQAEAVPSDTQRMDWIAMYGSFGVDSVTGLPGGNGQKRIAATRAAIDAAMAQGKKP